MCKRLMYVVCVATVLSLASSAMAASVLVSGFESGLEGWYTDQWVVGTISLSATGATEGTQAMLVEGPGGWSNLCKVDVKPHLAALANKGVKISLDVTAFAADMTTTWMQVDTVINAQSNDDNGANNNIGWNQFEAQGVAIDGQPHTLTWVLPDALTTKIAGADQNIGWFELQLISNVDGASVAKFYVDNIQISYEAASSSILVSSFESGLEGWYTDQWTAGTTAVGTTGATVGTQAMQVEAPGGWQQCTKVNAKPYMAALSNKGVAVTADVTAFDADMTTTWMQIGMILNCEGDDNAGANNNLGWIDLGSQDLPRDGQPHTLTWPLPDDVTGKVAGADDSIGWFEFLLISNVDANSVAKFYVDNVQVVGVPIVTAKSTDLVIGNFEQSLDGWVVGGGADVLFNDHNGVTLDQYSLDIYLVNGDWNQDVLVLNILDPNLPTLKDAFRSNTKVTADVTHLVADWPTDQAPGWNGKHLILNCGGDNWNRYLDLGYKAGWDQNAGDRTDSVTWDYSQQLGLINFDTITYLEFIVIVNANSADYTGWVWFYLDNMKLTGGGIALNPKPASGTKEVDTNTKLSWSPGAYATSHNLYLGTSSGAVAAADGNSNPSVTFVQLDGTSFDPNGLEFNTMYYWRVDAVNDVNPDSPWKGVVWNFTTANAIVVDDFETYGDNEDLGETIYQAWADGWADEIYGGSQVGNINPPFAERTTVHGGSQAMPLTYDNTTFRISEAVRTWAEPQDWTRNGYNTLRLYVWGNVNNLVDTLYIILEDSAGTAATVKCTDPKIMTTEAWTEWLIAASDFTGVDMTAVTKMTIGVGNPTGSPSKAFGLLYIDDIQVGAKPMGLVAWYKLEGNLNDSSGNGFNGTFAGDPNYPAKYVAGPTGMGQGLLFDGTGGGQNVELGRFNPSAATGKLTVALWAKWDGLSDQWQGLIGKRDGWSDTGNNNTMMWHIEAAQPDGILAFANVGSWSGSGDTALPIGVWTHIAVTFDGTTAKFYVNGTETSSASFSFGTKTDAMLQFGSDDPDGGNAFNGALDEVRIYDQALSATEVKALMTAK
jgi:hypothetical protein